MIKPEVGKLVFRQHPKIASQLQIGIIVFVYLEEDNYELGSTCMCMFSNGQQHYMWDFEISDAESHCNSLNIDDNSLSQNE